jgi:O-antigen ligase
MPGLAVLRPILLAQLLAISSTAIELSTGKTKFPAASSPWLLIMTGLLLGCVFSHLGNFYIDGATTALSEFGKTYITFIIIWINLNSVKRIVIFNLFLVLIATFIASHCILVALTGTGYGPEGWVTRTDAVGVIQAQFYGIFSDPNDTGQILILAIPLCFFLLLCTSSIFLKIIVAVVVASLMWGVLATESRGSFLSLAFTGFIALRSYFRPAQFIMIIAVGAALFPVLAPARLRGGLVDESSSDRVLYWSEATDAFKTNPLFGVGYHTIQNYTHSGLTVHNSYIEAYSELGIFGYTFWFFGMTFSVYSMARLSKVIPENKEEQILVNWMKCIVPALAGMYFAIFFLSRAYLLPMYVVFAVIAAAYNIVSQKIGITATSEYCYVGEKQIIRWPIMAIVSMVFIFITIRVLLRLTGG